MKIVAFVVGLSVFAGSAHAATTLRTPFIIASTSNSAVCIVTNVSAKPAVITLTLTDFAGAVVTPEGNTCATASLAPGASCLAIADTSVPDVKGFICTVVSSTNKVRAVGYGTISGGVVGFPATAK